MSKKHGERVLHTPNNRISIGVSLQNLNERVFKPNNIEATFLGGYLFNRRVSGVRVVAGGKTQTVADISFNNYGSHVDNYPVLPYFTAAATIGQSADEIRIFLARLDEALGKMSA